MTHKTKNRDKQSKYKKLGLKKSVDETELYKINAHYAQTMQVLSQKKK